MSAEEFWKDDPQLFVSYRTSFANRKKREMEEIDYKSWLLGLYIHDGQGKLFMSLKQFLNNMVASLFKGKKDHSKIGTYPNKPYGELQKDELKKKKKESERYINYQKDFVYYGTIKQRYIDQMRNKQKKGE